MHDERTLSEDRPTGDVSLLIVRAVVGVIFAAHGAQKLLGAFGGPGLAAIVEMMGPIGYPVAIGEFFGGLDRLAHLPLVVLLKRKDGHLAVFCPDSNEARRVRRVGREKNYFPTGLSWVWLNNEGALYLSFELGSDSKRPAKYLTSTLKWGPMLILLPL